MQRTHVFTFSFVLKYFTLTTICVHNGQLVKTKIEDRKLYVHFDSQTNFYSKFGLLTLYYILRTNQINTILTNIIISHTNLGNQIFKCNVNPTNIIDLSPNRSIWKTSHYKTVHSSEPNRRKKKTENILWIKWENPLRDSMKTNWRLRINGKYKVEILWIVSHYKIDGNLEYIHRRFNQTVWRGMNEIPRMFGGNGV